MLIDTYPAAAARRSGRWALGAGRWADMPTLLGLGACGLWMLVNAKKVRKVALLPLLLA